jgi:hypothetical protein
MKKEPNQIRVGVLLSFVNLTHILPGYRKKAVAPREILLTKG